MTKEEFEAIGELYGGEFDDRLVYDSACDYIDAQSGYDDRGIEVFAYQRMKVTLGMIESIALGWTQEIEHGESGEFEELMDPDGASLLNAPAVDDLRRGLVALLSRVLRGPNVYIWGCVEVARRDYSLEEIEAMR